MTAEQAVEVAQLPQQCFFPSPHKIGPNTEFFNSHAWLRQRLMEAATLVP